MTDLAAQRPRLLHNADLIALGLYFVVLWSVLFPIPGLWHGYDRLHHTALLMATVRIFDGQVPFRDFLPWYGPLYHYFQSFCALLTGGATLLSVKFFLYIASPLVSMAMLLGSVRLFGLAGPGRLFTIIAAACWSVGHLFHCGSTRSILGLFFLAIWARSIGTRWAGLIRLAVFPMILFAFFYSLDIGIYLVPAALVLALFDLCALSPSLRKGALLRYLVGAACAGLLLALLTAGTAWGSAYLAHAAYVSSNQVWIFGLPFPGPAEIAADPRALFHYLPLALVLITAVWTAVIRSSRNTREPAPIWIPAVTTYAALLWTSDYVRTSFDHLVYVLPPFMVLMGWLFQQRTRWHWHRVLLCLLVASGITTFDSTRARTAGNHINREHFSRSWPAPQWAGGVHVMPATDRMVQQVRQFCDRHPDEHIIFPLHGFEAYRAGQPLLLAHDDNCWLSMPSRQARLANTLAQLDARYAVIDCNNVFFSAVAEDLHPLLDYILRHYRPIHSFGTSIVYEKRESAADPVAVTGTVEGLIAASAENGFTVEWPVPEGTGRGFVEMNCRFEYQPGLLRRFSVPEMKVRVNGTLQDRLRAHGNGMERLRTTPEGGSFRAFLPGNAGRVALTITFPGMLNARPERVEFTGVRFCSFSVEPRVPFSPEFLRSGY